MATPTSPSPQSSLRYYLYQVVDNNNENIIDNKISEDENSLFDDHDDYEKPGLEIDLNNPYAGINKDESSSNDAKVS